jgi:fermentation-respiration switch protein FrsA (DUF1100 family)
MPAFLMRILIFLALALVALYAFAQFVRRTSMFFPDKYPRGDWNTAALDETFTTDDGVRLHGWLFRAADPRAPLLVWMHGNGGNITERAPMAVELARRGISVLLFDWRGYGKSGGTPSEDGLYRDALAAVDFARTHAGGDLALYGESLGGPYAAYAATQRRVRCIIIENSFPSLTALGNALYRPIPLGWFAPRAMTTLRWLNAANVPVLVLHGRRDQVIPFPLGQQLFDSLTTPKEMLISDTAGHCEMPFVEKERYYDAVVRFVKP